MATPDRVPWRDVATMFEKEHRQGQHVGVVGPNGSGKSVLLVEFSKIRAAKKVNDGNPSRVTYLATKPRDPTLDALGWPVIKKWPPGYGQWHTIVWPPYGDPETVVARQRNVFRPLLRQIFVEGKQTVTIDELLRFTERKPNGMDLGPVINQFLIEARSNEGSLFAGTQRPRNVVRSFWSEPVWFGIFRIHDYDDLRRVHEIGGKSEGLDVTVSELDDFEFVLIRRRGSKRDLYISKVEL